MVTAERRTRINDTTIEQGEIGASGITFISLLKQVGLYADNTHSPYRLTSTTEVGNGLIRHFRKDRLSLEDFLSGNNWC